MKIFFWLKNMIFNRFTIFGGLILLQVGLLAFTVLKMAQNFFYVYVFLTIFSLIIVFWLVSSKDNPSYKLAWTIFILTVPIVGGLFYILFGTGKVSSKLRKKSDQQEKILKNNAPQDASILEEIKQKDLNIFNQINYVNTENFPVYKNAYAQYFPLGEKKFERLITYLKAAKKYILLEYFIIEKGALWESILNILIEKTQENVEILVIYDDCGSLGLVPFRYDLELEALGIKCKIFNPFVPSLSITMNNRDHRKICIIDGEVAFTGGVNIADEYINKKVIHGHWKDSAIEFKGEAVKSLIYLFFENWNLICYDEKDTKRFMPKEPLLTEFDGYIQPYGTSPFDDDEIGENIYLNMINKAKREVFIMTPYLIIDNELQTALILAAKNGVSVKIITPGIADKWYVHLVTQANYPALIEAGVEIYEYTPGFIHSKIFVCDGEIGTVGTINLDYRSLFLHFECGVLLYNSKTLLDIREDYIETLSKSKLCTMDDCRKVKWYKRITRGLIRVLSPIM